MTPAQHPAARDATLAQERDSGQSARVGPCSDVYSMSPVRDRATIERFLATYSDDQDLVGRIADMPPLAYQGPVDELPLEEWESIPFNSIDELLALGLEQPPRAFTVYLRALPPWCGVILCFARSGEITYGVSVDDPLNTEQDKNIARRLLPNLCAQTSGHRGWATSEMPPSIDPNIDRPWDDSATWARFERPDAHRA